MFSILTNKNASFVPKQSSCSHVDNLSPDWFTLLSWWYKESEKALPET